MAERRSLVEGLKTTPAVDPTQEKDFVFGKKGKQALQESPAAMDERRGDTMSRVPLTTRMRTDFAKALKRASLERQLSGTFPNSLQEILEEAMEPWLRKNGYLD